MRKHYLWMLAAILICGTTMTLTSCSGDNAIGDKTTPTPKTEYKIEVEEGMTLPDNDFLKVPAVAGDQNIIKALKAIDKVTDVKAFKMEAYMDYYNNKMVTKTAYFFNFKQPVDHNNPSKGWYKQQCVLTVAGQDRPTVLHTEGYALNNDKNKLQEMFEPMLVSVLEANCLQVEHRYHGWSLPEGYTNKWTYLNAKQQSDDLHAIVTAIKKSGVLGKNSKWIATGVSKGGETTAYYAYHYPNEIDAYVPFCAPLLTTLKDERPYSYILSVQAFNDKQENLDKVKNAFRTYISDKNLQAECVEVYRKKKPEYASSLYEDLRISLLTNLFANHFPRMSYVAYKRWEDMIPKAGDSAEKFYNFIMSSEKTKYPGETEEQYNRRKDYLDFDTDGSATSMSRAFTRTQTVTRHDPYYVQACKELGNYIIMFDWADDLLTAEEKSKIQNDENPDAYGVTYDNGKFEKEVLEGLKQSTCNMMFVYGSQDPWTGGQIPDDKLGVNSQKLIVVNPSDSPTEAGLHNDFIDQWNASKKAQLFKWLKQLGFLPNE